MMDGFKKRRGPRPETTAANTTSPKDDESSRRIPPHRKYKTRRRFAIQCCLPSLLLVVTLVYAWILSFQDDSYYDYARFEYLEDLLRRYSADRPTNPCSSSNTCPSAKLRTYLRFDEAGPKAFPGTARSPVLPNAVPEWRRIPPEYAQDEAYHIARRTNTSTKSIVGQKGRRKPFYSSTPDSGMFNWDHNYTLDHRALYLYNPSILPLSIVEKEDRLSQHDLHQLTGGDPNVRYLATFRANTGGNCFGSDRTQVMKTGEQINYLAVALLDSRLDLIPGSDVLIDINAGPAFGKYFQQFQDDCRLFLLQGVIHILCNERIFRVTIRRTTSSRTDSFSDARSTLTTNYYTGQDQKCPYVYPNIYGDGLMITQWSRSKLAGGKNLNIFRSHDKGHYYVQVFPLPHTYKRIHIPPRENLLAEVRTDPDEQRPTAALPAPSFDGPDTPNTIRTCPENNQKGTFVTNCANPVDNPFFGDHDHGTACCIPLTLHNDTVLVGISHTKTTLINNPWWRRDIRGKYNGRIGQKRYLSRWIAYQPNPPFDVVARSGWFCLGPGEPHEASSLARNDQQPHLDLFNDTFQCPMVHFASGLSEFVGDSSKAVIGYGVSDCYARLMVVSKADIARRLLGT